MEKILKDKKMMAIIIIGTTLLIGCLCLIGFGVSKVVEKKTNNISQEDKQLLEMGVSKNDIKKMTKEEKEKVLNEEYYLKTKAEDYKFDNKKKEYKDTKSTMKVILSLLGSYKFSSITDKLEPLLDKYNFTTAENRELVRIYEDSTMLSQVYKLSDDAYENVMQNLTSPTVFAAIYLGAPLEVANDYTIFDASSYPIFEGVITTKEAKKLTADEFKEEPMYNVLVEYFDLENDEIYKTVTSGKGMLGSDTVTCYIKKIYTGALNVAGCEDVNGTGATIRSLID